MTFGFPTSKLVKVQLFGHGQKIPAEVNINIIGIKSNVAIFVTLEGLKLKFGPCRYHFYIKFLIKYP